MKTNSTEVKVYKSQTELDRVTKERDEAIRASDLSREASNRDLEAKRLAEQVCEDECAKYAARVETLEHGYREFQRANERLRGRATFAEAHAADAQFDADRLRKAELEARKALEVVGGNLEARVAEWIRTRIGADHIAPRERAMRLLEEAFELAQAEGITGQQAIRQIEHVYARPAGNPEQEAGGVAVCLLGWCAAHGTTFREVALREIERIEAKPIEEIRGSLARKHKADLVVCVPVAEAKGE